MTDPTAAESLAYVDSLGVHSVYSDALAKRAALGDKLLELSNVKNRIRTVEAFKSDREMEVLSDEQAKHSSQSATWLKEHMRQVYSNDGDIRESRDELATLAGERDLIEYEIDMLNQDIKIAVARLHELGGYLQFMAVIKQADEARKAREAKQSLETGNPWT
jgi:hypothetical protein